MRNLADRPAVARTGSWTALILIAGSVLATAVALEAVLRWLPPEIRGYEVSGRSLVHPREFARDPTRNSLGFHDVEHARNPDGRTRVLLLGDSYVEASSVPLPQTVGRQLEACLNEQPPGGYEVMSVGRGGWGQERELQALRELAPDYRPDVVVTLFLALNDVLDDSPELRRRQQEITARLLRHRPEWLQLPFDRAPGLVLERSELNRFLSFRLALLASRVDAHASGDRGIPVAYFVYAERYDAAWAAAWVRKEQLITATQGYVSEQGARYLMVSASTPQGVLGPRGLEQLERVYPSMRGRSWDLDKPDRLLAGICERHDIPVLLLEPLFREAESEGQHLHWRFDGHWNADGNRMAAQRIAAFVLDRQP